MLDDPASAPVQAAVSTRGTPRRTFLARLAALAAALPILGRHLSAPQSAGARTASSGSHAQPNVALLGALGAALLPSELGPDATRRAVSDFQRWMDGYRPNAEANHGYGTGTIQRLRADPRPRWRAQLAALDQEARRNHGRSFTALSRSDRQAVLRASLANVRGESLPSPAAAPHVALALLAHFYESPAATDLCYEATIGRQLCRPLSAAPLQPVPLTRRAP